jgi:hypothetical protein
MVAYGLLMVGSSLSIMRVVSFYSKKTEIMKMKLARKRKTDLSPRKLRAVVEVSLPTGVADEQYRF